ncbi:uncharacterized protein LOC122048716 [Zingiber officinale]|uniref:uncharacterized protein LOC122048716 n=1 Tax=Zingiber officinale TaxID=94328 RepID=UPI001C4AFF67|nr:uncharacterized protein LOC122048716 [Zingiber officinale]
MSDREEKTHKRKRSENKSSSVKDTSDDNDSSFEVHAEAASATHVHCTDQEDEKINDTTRDKDNLVPETSVGDQSGGALCEDKSNLNLSLELVSPTTATDRNSDEHPFGVNIEIIVEPKDATPNYPPDEDSETKNTESEKKNISNNAIDGPSRSNTGKLPLDYTETTGLNLSLFPTDSTAQSQINQEASQGCFMLVLKGKGKGKEKEKEKEKEKGKGKGKGKKVQVKLFGVTYEVEQPEQASEVSQEFPEPIEASQQQQQQQQPLSCSDFENKGHVEGKALQHCFGEGSSSSRSLLENSPENYQRDPTEWLEEELDCLWVGVRRHGQQSWNTLLADPNLSFKRFRVAEDFNKQWEKELAKILNGIMIPHPISVKPPLAPPFGRALVRTACPNNRQLNSSHARIQTHQTSTGPSKSTLPHWLVDALKANQKNSEPPPSSSSPNAADPGCGENKRKRPASDEGVGSSYN